jgi:hypothetical protein
MASQGNAAAVSSQNAGKRGPAFEEGKLFLGGLVNSTSKASLEAYCNQWCALSQKSKVAFSRTVSEQDLSLSSKLLAWFEENIYVSL